MERVNILVIGAGVIGLATAKYLSQEHDDVVIAEKEESFGRHTSSRNSEVIHSGLYYPQKSLKAQLCVKGLDLLYRYLKDKALPYSNCGKIVVATDKEEIPALFRLKENGQKNGIKGLRIIDKDECHQLEPAIKVEKALLVPATGIFDTHKFMASLEKEAEANDAFVVYNMEVTAISRKSGSYIVDFSNGEKFQSNVVINCAGLFCENVARLAGIATAKSNLRIHWCKGEYYKTTRIKGIKHLIYPVPDPRGISLGIHLSINLNGEVRFGPNAYYIDEINYRMDESYKKEFLEAVNRYIGIAGDDLNPDDCGIRAKLQGANEGFRDFYIRDEAEKGLPGFINLMGIESPGLTCSLAIAEYITSLVRQI